MEVKEFLFDTTNPNREDSIKKLGFKLFGNERFDAEYNKLVKEYEDSLKNKQK